MMSRKDVRPANSENLNVKIAVLISKLHEEITSVPEFINFLGTIAREKELFLSEKSEISGTRNPVLSHIEKHIGLDIYLSLYERTQKDTMRPKDEPDASLFVNEMVLRRYLKKRASSNRKYVIIEQLSESIEKLAKLLETLCEKDEKDDKSYLPPGLASYADETYRIIEDRMESVVKEELEFLLDLAEKLPRPSEVKPENQLSTYFMRNNHKLDLEEEAVVSFPMAPKSSTPSTSGIL